MRKRISSIIIGILILALGITLVGDILGGWDINFFFEGWWTVLIMIVSLLSIISDKPNVVNVYFLLFGGAMLLRSCGVISKDVSGWLIALALLVVALGFKMIISAIFKTSGPVIAEGHSETSSSPNGTHKGETAFSDQTFTFAGLEFTSADYDVSFGKLTLDLRGANIADNAFLSIDCIFGGATVLVSPETKVSVSHEAIFGAVKNFADGTGEKILNVKAEAVFGAIEIKKG